jgi:hypothetical protein
MREEKIVQFVSFETVLDTEKFILQLEDFTRSGSRGDNITLQRSEKNGLFKYITQHRGAAGFKFIFEKGRRSSKSPEIHIRTVQEGGYSILQLDRTEEARSGESKIFSFLPDASADLQLYKKLAAPHTLNIYQSYYENCRWAYVLEFFTKNKLAEDLLRQVKQYNNGGETAIYKEYSLQLS